MSGEKPGFRAGLLAGPLSAAGVAAAAKIENLRDQALNLQT